MKRWQSIALGIVISLIALVYTLHGNDLNQIGVELIRGRYIYVIPGLAFFILALYGRARRWQILLGHRMTIDHSFFITAIGYVLNTFLPLRIGEVIRALLTTRLKPPVALVTSLSSLVVERLTDFLALVVILLWAINLNVSDAAIESAARLIGIMTAAGMIMLTIFAANRPLAHRFVGWALRAFPILERLKLRVFVDHLLDGLAPLTSITGFVEILFWTALSWLASIIMGFVILYVFYDQPTWAAALVIVASATIAGLLPAMPGNVGPFEAATVAGLMLVGLAAGTNPTERAIAFSVTFHVVLVLAYSVAGIYGLAQEHLSFGELRGLLTPVLAAARSVTKNSS